MMVNVTLLNVSLPLATQKSLRTILNNEDHYHVHHAIKVGDYNVGRDGELLTLPFYMAFLLTAV